MTVISLDSYKDQLDIKEHYHIHSGTDPYIQFQGRRYKCIDELKVHGSGKRIITYRNELERHNIVIHLQYGVVMDVQVFYKI